MAILNIKIDGKRYEVESNFRQYNLLQACLSLGFKIPYFCWHPALGSLGACRQCAVKDEISGKLVMSCMTPIKDNISISILDKSAVYFRKSVIEFLMTNHPHDCPVCEEGGHCHLQDMTVITGHNRRRYNFSKRTHENQELGPFIANEMNRCIACYRCVRYYRDYAGGTDLGVLGVHDNLYFGSGVLESEFSGNLTEICPTGVFTDRTQTYTRKWDLQFSPSICHGCSSGCNISPGERNGSVRRIENRYNCAVNNYFICDRGRFGYGYVNRKDRPRKPLLRYTGELSLECAKQSTVERLRKARRVIGIGSPRASLESNFALCTLVGKENFSTGIAAEELECLQLMLKIQRELKTPSMREIESNDSVIILGEDITQTAARVALAIRQIAKGWARENARWHSNAVNIIAQNKKNPVYIAAVRETRLDDIASHTFYGTPDEIARIGFALANAIDKSAPRVCGLDKASKAMVVEMARVLKHAKRPLIVAGDSLFSQEILRAAANIAIALKSLKKNVFISLISREANSTGLAMLGGKSLDWALKKLEHLDADAVVIIENDIYRRANKSKVDAALKAANTVIVLDHQQTATLHAADIALPVATFAEGNGTLISQEGRAQRFFQVYSPRSYRPEELTYESWRWLHALNSMLEGRRVNLVVIDDVTRACADALPTLAGIKDAAPSASFRIKGLKLARSPHRSSGRTAMRANLVVSEQRQPQDKNSAFAFSMEGYSGACYPRPFAWAPGWNSPQAFNLNLNFTQPQHGVRLFDEKEKLAYFIDIPKPFKRRENQWLVLPLYHLFGSDETSAYADAIQARIPEPYVAIGQFDINALGLWCGKRVSVKICNYKLTLTINVSKQIRRGVIGIPVLPNMPSEIYGHWAVIE